jgi:hypothetical protein
MRDLALSTFSALERGELTHLLDPLNRRLFCRPPADLMDVQRVGDAYEWRFKPMIELLLRHIAQIAADERRSSMQRETEIIWAVEIAGF